MGIIFFLPKGKQGVNMILGRIAISRLRIDDFSLSSFSLK